MTVRHEAGQRLRRLLAVLTWLARVRRAPVAELAERFGMSPEDLVADLELAACCGLPPYTPDQLMEIMVDEHEVVAELGDELAQPRRLTPAEGFALAASGRAILATPGSDPDGALARALDKLDAALGAAGSLRIDLGGDPHLAELRRAVDEGRQLRVRYYSLSSDEETERVVDPWALVALDGRWYLDAWCHRADSERRFRVDRLVDVAQTGDVVDHPAPADGAAMGDAPEGPAAFVPGPDAVVAEVLVDPAGMWLVEAVPTLSVEPARGGRTTVRLAVASTVWFERLLLRLGPHAEVRGPKELVGAGRSAAERLLERYREAVPPAD
ncbi:MAG TPA: WYL domain-containing protein [Acidimicrobiales bacterium]|nr:WYL domain-containing protein [Acidimicrobiales bacterium]